LELLLFLLIPILNKVRPLIELHKEGIVSAQTYSFQNKGNRDMIPYSIKECQDHAITRHGLCLSTEYINSGIKMLWQCLEGHTFVNDFDHIKNRKQWCPKCAGVAKPEFNDVEIEIENRQGKLITTKYVNSKTKLEIICKNGHSFKMTYSNIIYKNQWCPRCSNCYKSTIEEVAQEINSKGGVLLSTEYKNNKTKIKVKCSKGHIWETRLNDIRNNHWCPDCKAFKTEYECKGIIEKILGIEMVKTRFYVENQRLEFDGYNKKCKIAFEYQGEQHYSLNRMWHKTEKDFIRQQERDKMKVKYAEENNITLLIIPFNKKNILEEYITSIIGISA